MPKIDFLSFSNALLEKAMGALIILVVGYILIRILLHIERRALEKSKLDPSVYTLIMRVTRMALWVILILTLLAEMDVNLAPIIAALSACGVAIALALKDSLGNVAGGIILMFNQPFVAGDEIEINGNVGLVDRIDLMTTHLHTYDGRDIIIPNGTVTTSIVTNATRRELRRSGFQFTVSYGTDFEQVRKAILAVVAEHPKMLDTPAPYIIIAEHTTRGMVVNVGVWAKTEDRFDVEAAIPILVAAKFEEEGIKTPSPTLDITVEDSRK